MKSIHWILTLLALFQAACGSSSEQGGNGGNTNWLKPCDKNADCGDEDRCVSQVCLKPCDSADACGVQNTACEALEPAKLTAAGACETQEAADFCTLKCDKDRDCRTLRGAFTCEEGRCQPSCTALLAVGDADGGVQDAGTKEQPSEAGAGKDGLPAEAGASISGLPPQLGAACDPRLGCEGDSLRCSAEDCNVTGTCVLPEELACDDVYEPVCACDGQTYSNLCVAGGAAIEQSGECGGDEPGKSSGECLLVGNAEACCPELLAVDREELDSNPCLFEIIGGEYQIPEEVIAECPPPPCPPVTCLLDEKVLNGTAMVTEDGTCALQPDCDGPNCAGDPCDPSVGCPSDTLVCEAASCGATGVCRRRPITACGPVSAPVCGCDGQTYGNLCTARVAVAHEGECDAPAPTGPDGQCVLARDIEGSCCSFGAVAVRREQLSSEQCLFEVTAGGQTWPDAIPPVCDFFCPEIPCGPPDAQSPGFFGQPVANEQGMCSLEPTCEDGSCPGSPCDPRVGCDPDWSCEGADCPLGPQRRTLVCVADSCDGPGHCLAAEPPLCDDVDSPVCGCDGQSYSNACYAGYAPVDYVGECVSACSAAGQGCDDASCCEGLACVAGTCRLAAE